MKKGLFFGTFNPIHMGHLILAEYLAWHTDLDKIIFIVSPHNPLKNKNELMDENHRLAMVKLATSGNSRFEVNDIEFRLPTPSYTYQTLETLKSGFPGDEFTIIMGSDSLLDIEKWKNHKYILDNYRLFIYPRPGFNISKESFPATELFLFSEAPLLNISGTFIRENFNSGKSIRYMVTESVHTYLENIPQIAK